MPKSGILHAEAIKSAPRPQRKARSVDALKACDDDPDVVCAVARLFLNDRKLDKARAWFNRAATLRPEDGDMWVRYYAFEKSLEDDAENNLNAVSKKTKKAKTDVSVFLAERGRPRSRLESGPEPRSILGSDSKRFQKLAGFDCGNRFQNHGQDGKRRRVSS